MIRIEILNGPEEGRVAEFGSGTYLLGRNSSAGLVLHGSAVSGQHLEMVVEADDTVRFRDLGSTNGTWSGGLKVQEGEWFPGTEMRLGDVKLRLLTPEAGGGGAAAGLGEDEEAGGGDLHRRALQQAMGSKKRGGPLLFLLLVVAIGAAAWWFLGGDDPEPGPVSAGAVPGPAVGASGPADLLDGLGRFGEEAAASWQLGAGLAIEGEALRARAEGSQRAVLTRRFDAPGCGLVLEAEVSGGRVWPVLEFGSEGAESASASWAGGALGSGPTEIALPCEAGGWFRVSLLLESGAVVRGLRAGESEAQATESQPAIGWSMVHAGANLLFDRQGVPLLRAVGTGGSWSPTEDGASFEPAADGWLRLRPGPEQDLLVLSEGAPLNSRDGGEIQQATGLLLRGPAKMWARFDRPVRVVAGPDGLGFEQLPAFRLSWKLEAPLNEAARLDRAIRRADQDRDSAALLSAARELVNRWPIDEDQVLRTERLRDRVVAGGRQELAALEQSVAEALFLAAEDEMRRVEERAVSLAARFPGTEIEREAMAMVEVLVAEADQLGAARRQQASEYRSRLMNALHRAYPVLAAWMES
ncbi:MAG: FHA domain-containing protein [Planctomycetes bacterium]|nr:FHA domain-containing protein [Planctomycetota bacterium]